MLADGLRAHPDPEAPKSASANWGAFQVLSSESLSRRNSFASSVTRGGLPGAEPSASPSKRRFSQRSRSREMLASLRPVYAEIRLMLSPLPRGAKPGRASAPCSSS